MKEAKKIISAGLIAVALWTAFTRNSIWEDGLALWSDVVSKAPNNPRGLYNLGLLMHHQNRYNEALELFKRVIDINKQTWFVLSEIGAVYADMGYFEDALAWHGEAKRLAKKESEYADVLEFMGITYVKMGDRQTAMGILSEAYSLNPESPTLNYHLGNIYREIDIGVAMRLYEKAISLNPDYYEAIIDLANLYDDSWKSEDALRLYKKAIARYPDAPEAYYNLGVFYERRGEVDKAIEYYKKAVTIDPEYPEPLSRLRFLNASH